MEVGVARQADQSERFWIYDDAAAGFKQLAADGYLWAPGSGATFVAFGDVDGDGRVEMGLSRSVGTVFTWPDSKERYSIIDDCS